MVTNDARCTREIKYRIFIAKAAFGKKKNPFTSKLEETSKVLYLELALFGAETWTFRKVGHKYLESFEMCCW